MQCLPRGATPNYPVTGSVRYLRKIVLLMTLLLGFYSYAFAQQVVSGRVFAADTALANASVQVKGESVATQTDTQGRFSIKAAPNATLIISYIGFITREVKIGNQTSITVKLDAAANQTSDVVVVGYGKQKLPTVTGAVSVVSGKELTQTPVSNITNMLVGRTSGISAVQNSGEPGQNAATIRIRGIATLNGQNPLIVIDGVQQPTEQPYVILNAMDANEIENISILKDASATAVYGIRGANGVIIVTTKRGRANRPQFSFTANQGLTKAAGLFETLNSYDFATLRNTLVRNAQAAGNFSYNALLFTDDELWKFQNNRDYTPAQVDGMSNLTASQKDALKNSPALYYTSHNYYKELFDGTGLQNQYNLNVSGGTAKVKYFTSLGYFQQNGILTNTSFEGANTNPNFKRYNFRSNFDIEVARNFQLSFNIGGLSSVNRVVGSGASGDFANRYQSIIQGILENSPFVGPGFVDGRLVTSFIGTTGDTINPLINKGGSGGSPISAVLTGGNRIDYTSTLNTAVTLRHTMGYLTKGLESHVRIAYDNSYTKGYVRTNQVPTYSAMRNPSNPADILFIGGIVGPDGAADNSGSSSWRKLYIEAGVNYDRAFGSHNVSALVLGNAQKYTQTYQAFNTPSGLMGLVGRVAYNFKEKYLLEFNMGLNGTENFAPGMRFGYFPAVSGGWIISKESFFKANKWISFAKIRGSYGEVGNDQIGGSRYLYLPNTWVTNAAGYWFGNSNGSSTNPSYAGAAESALGNPAVTWERAQKLNLSVDLKFLNDRLSLTGTYFQEKRNNILLRSGIVPVTIGVSTLPAINLGRVSNKGYEVESEWNDRVGQVSYFVRGNFSYARNKIDYMAEAPYPYSWMNVTGYSIGQYKGYLTDGFFNTQKELDNRPYNANGNNARLGDIRYVDVTGDGIINQNDQVPIGYSNLPQIAYNMTIGFSYKGFDINALFIGTAKGSFSQFGYILNTPFAKNVGQVIQHMYDNMWTPERAASGANIEYPAYSFAGGGPNLFSNVWLRSNNFQRLKNLEIGYTFSRKLGLLAKANIRGVRVYANGNNLATWGSEMIPGIDPEMADAGKNNQGYLFPLTRTYNFGVNVQF